MSRPAGAAERPSAVVLGVNDPGRAVAEAIAREVDRLGAAADRVGGILGEAKKQAAREMTPVLIGEVSRSIDRLLLQRYRYALAGAGVAVVLALGAGVALDRYVLPSSSVPVVARCEPHQPGQPFNCTMQLRGE